MKSAPPLDVQAAQDAEVRPHEVSPHLAAALNAALNEPLADAKKREKDEKKRKKEEKKREKEAKKV